MSKSQGLSDYELPKLLSISSLKGHELGVDFNFDKQKNNKSPPLICQGMEGTDFLEFGPETWNPILGCSLTMKTKSYY